MSDSTDSTTVIKTQKSTTRFEYRKEGVRLDFTISKENTPHFIAILEEALKDLKKL